jgi:uncharacterized protein
MCACPGIRPAEQGNAAAQNNLGAMYDTGRGVAQDHVQAQKWFILGAAAGNAQAAKNRDNVAAKMTPVQITEAQELARTWRVK